jgi:UDP-3-O-[3-hydroxymyristoyl] glucosamine N-acyltransferase
MPAPTRFRLSELAARFGLELIGDGACWIEGVGTLALALPTQLSFLANPRYRSELALTHAGAIVVAAADAKGTTKNLLISHNPYADFARIGQCFEQRAAAEPGVHPSAVIAPGAHIDASASIAALCVVEATARVETGAVIGPGCIIGPGCVVGAQSRLVARVTLVERVLLGHRVLVHPGAVIGADGFGLAMDAGHWLKVPQLGGVVIGDDCEIGANTTIDRGAIDDTVLEEDVRLDNQIQIGHNVFIGAHTAIAGCAAIAGSARIGRNCLIGGAAGIIGHIEIADRVVVGAMSLVTHSLREPGEYCSGTPIQEKRAWRKNAARFRHLDELARKIIQSGTPSNGQAGNEH